VAAACQQALSAPVSGHEIAIVAAEDTCMNRSSADLMAEVYPDVRLTRELRGRETLLSIDHARAVLGYAPRYRWSDVLDGLAED
jgi:nucleoside-diphosphate-sugar epimerase